MSEPVQPQPTPLDSTIRRRVHRVLSGADSSAAARAIRGGIMILIVVNVVFVVLESVPSIAARHGRFFQAFEIFSVGVYSAEYFLRLWAIVEDPRFARPFLGRLHYAGTFMAVVDLVAIVPFFLPRLIAVDTRFVRAFRLLRLLRILKLGRNRESFEIYARVFRAKAGDLTAALAMLIVLLLLSSSLMYFIEHEAQPEMFGTIPKSMWWGIITMTTIGYGDAIPATAIGKLLGGGVALLGVAFFALPPSILIGGIMEEMQRPSEPKQSPPPREPAVCPSCGAKLGDSS